MSSEQKEKSIDTEEKKEEKKPIRIWVDGCFDLMHFGHANALRQAKNIGDYLIVGVHSDAEIRKHKGPPVMNETERYAAVRACKWVDQVVENAPYITQVADLFKYNVDFCVHGDDASIGADGVDTYGDVKKAGKYKEVPRTTGVSSTDIVSRMLQFTKLHHKNSSEEVEKDIMLKPMSEGTDKRSPYTGVSKFIPTGGKIRLFSEGKEPKKGDKIVYVDGTFDLFHLGHINLLREAKRLGDFLLVGVVDDDVVNSYKGENHPIMNLYERLLTVLSCRFVDEVVIGAPLQPTKEFLEALNVHIVVRGKDPLILLPDGSDPYKYVKEMGKYVEIDSNSQLSTSVIIERVANNWSMYSERNKKKEAKEIAFLSTNNETKNK